MPPEFSLNIKVVSVSGALMRIIFSALISLVTFFAPREKYERKLSMLPAMEEKAQGYNLNGWTYTNIRSEQSGARHYYYTYPSQNDSLPVLLMLHGFNTDGRVFQNLTLLASRFRLIAYNFPEESSFYQGNFYDFVRILDDFCTTIGVDTLCVAGNSVGGAIALCYAAHSRNHVNRLLLISSEIFGMTEEDRRRSQAMADKLLKYPDYKLYFLLEKTRSLLRRLEQTGYGEDAPSEILVIRRIGWYRQILRALRGFDGSDIVDSITCPVIAVHGSDDNVIPLSSAKTITSLFPHAYFKMLENAGHAMVYLEGDKVSSILLDQCTEK